MGPPEAKEEDHSTTLCGGSLEGEEGDEEGSPSRRQFRKSFGGVSGGGYGSMEEGPVTNTYDHEGTMEMGTEKKVEDQEEEEEDPHRDR